MRYALLILSFLFLIGCEADNRLWLRDNGYKDLWCNENDQCVSLDSLGNIYYTGHKRIASGEATFKLLLYKIDCKEKN